ncbi:gas vesicle accessory protein GvpU [Salibacterium qingdaonense]|uniref:Gas vesicle protein GvpU n=1 Tax=Salibacterium qingdaonense TaxID=266892 RepID=A0A1I4QIB3_9BACI|nr:gas vesicle accessory protein GvpU [Salibacterium qingdaonense]SFM39809.1 hypothetical protein SAMN04488054_14310 [Salibacterium qingdaonense]
MKEVQEDKHSDYVLRYLVRLADNGAEMDITLNVGGATITGVLIGNVKYLEELERTLHRGNSDLESKMTTFFEKMSDKFQRETDQDEYESGYIHLRKAKLVDSQGKVPIHGSLWRGKISDVNGFSFESVQ